MAKKGDWTVAEVPVRYEVCWFRQQDAKLADRVAEFLSKKTGQNHFVENSLGIFAVVVTYGTKKVL